MSWFGTSTSTAQLNLSNSGYLVGFGHRYKTPRELRSVRLGHRLEPPPTLPSWIGTSTRATTQPPLPIGISLSLFFFFFVYFSRTKKEKRKRKRKKHDSSYRRSRVPLTSPLGRSQCRGRHRCQPKLGKVFHPEVGIITDGTNKAKVHAIDARCLLQEHDAKDVDDADLRGLGFHPHHHNGATDGRRQQPHHQCHGRSQQRHHDDIGMHLRKYERIKDA